MAGPEDTSGGKDLTSCAEDETFSDQKFGEENDEHINVEDTTESDQAIVEDGEQLQASETGTVSADLELDQEYSGPDSEQPASATNIVSESIDNESANDVADNGRSDQPNGVETGLHEEEPDVQGVTEQMDGQAQASDFSDRVFRLPLSRVKHIIKMDPDVTLASQEAVVTIARAAELFISALSRDASYKTIQGRRRVVLRRDLEHIMDTRECYAFLEGAMDS
ncbi:uncharacterized protein LOC143280611 [Babylonia areolata]|uniref:uncharacterized protein LOC143280611 n=1 Tax=Babylonia areolata TaxID=304850 RepID=UPI003FD6A73B